MNWRNYQFGVELMYEWAVLTLQSRILIHNLLQQAALRSFCLLETGFLSLPVSRLWPSDLHCISPPPLLTILMSHSATDTHLLIKDLRNLTENITWLICSDVQIAPYSVAIWKHCFSFPSLLPPPWIKCNLIIYMNSCWYVGQQPCCQSPTQN